tara:strand:+ start:225 stop:509 length:285 start_codon:yes stop_codon:yes gene_type:complete
LAAAINRLSSTIFQNVSVRGSEDKEGEEVCPKVKEDDCQGKIYILITPLLLGMEIEHRYHCLNRTFSITEKRTSAESQSKTEEEWVRVLIVIVN